jgi:exopolysaccharide production protein ExoZ
MSTSRHYDGVQALRGFAALMVVAFHAQLMVRDKLNGLVINFQAGASGVDIFFAISGFVMVITTASAWGEPDLWRSFLRRRLMRIVPLYWCITAAFASLLLLYPRLAEHSSLMPWHTIASFLFIPAWNGEHKIAPLLVAGWTLSYEMLFYLLFAFALRLRLHPVHVTTVALMALSAIGLFRTDAWGAPSSLLSPMLMEFVFGMWIGMATLKGRQLPAPVAQWLAPLSVLLLLATNALPTQICFDYRLIFWGIPGAALLASIIALESKWNIWFQGLPVLLGDASYAVYLSHSLFISLLSVILLHLHLGAVMALGVGFIGSLLVAATGGIVIHHKFEKPLAAWLRKWSRPGAPMCVAP